MTRDNDLSWTARLAWDVADNLNAYISYATGFKASSFNLSRDSRPPDDDAAALAGAGLITLHEETFSRDGKVIPFWRVYLTDAGRASGIGAVGAVRLTEAATARPAGRKRASVSLRSRRS